MFVDASAIVAILTGEPQADTLAACSRYGKGQGQPAQLNLGDCFAYAAARHHDTTLLFKGDGFSKTDIRPANMP